LYVRYSLALGDERERLVEKPWGREEGGEGVVREW
jgi:hypothetical protein